MQKRRSGGANVNNLHYIDLEDSRLPVILISNVCHIINKMDDFYVNVVNYLPDIIFLTETWLNADILDSAVNLTGYQCLRKDRNSGDGGGVAAYISNDFYLHRLSEFENQDFEVLWFFARPQQLPRPLSVLLCAVVYCPPSYNADTKRSLSKYIVQTCDTLLRKYVDAAIFISGDFNDFNCDCFTKQLNLTQIVSRPTRKTKILDKLFTNCPGRYRTPEIFSPIGKSDHNVVIARPNFNVNQPRKDTPQYVVKRSYTPTVMSELANALNRVCWQHMYAMEDVNQQLDFYYNSVFQCINDSVPCYFVKSVSTDKPWITHCFRQLIARRGAAFASGNIALYKNLRNRVNRVRKSLQTQYYLDKINHLKNDKPANWWKNLKLICGLDKGVNDDNVFQHMLYNAAPVEKGQLANVINDFLVKVTHDIPPVDKTVLLQLRNSLDPVPDQLIVPVNAVMSALSRIKTNKSVGPDGISHRILKDMSFILAEPLTAIINTSIRLGTVPDAWKISRVTPLPKVMPPVNIETDIRPIAITNVMAKIAERFVGQFFNEYFDGVIDGNQFGCVRGRSTTHALIKVVHELFHASDNPHNFIRILFVDFSKAFDRIDHNVLMRKLAYYNIPQHIVSWSMDFLADRKQIVKIGNVFSHPVITNAGVPQGTISGPNDFKLLINDLTFASTYVKYVDDTTVLSISCNADDCNLQACADHLVSWCRDNNMLINENKTKEMLIYFGKQSPPESINNITINGKIIERVSVFKLLGVFISSDLSWNYHVNYLLCKVSKRFHCIRCLVRAGVKDSDIVVVYSSIIRSVLEYACPVWHPGLTRQQSDELEAVQKRCLRIIYPSLTYDEALIISNLERLDVRRERFTRTLFEEMKNDSHPLHSVLPNFHQSQFDLRKEYPIPIPLAKKNRYGRDIVPYCIARRY
jgi:hypothetical protein